MGGRLACFILQSGEPRESLGGEDSSGDGQEFVVLPYCLSLLAGKRKYSVADGACLDPNSPSSPCFPVYSEAKLIQMNSPPVFL